MINCLPLNFCSLSLLFNCLFRLSFFVCTLYRKKVKYENEERNRQINRDKSLVISILHPEGRPEKVSIRLPFLINIFKDEYLRPLLGVVSPILIFIQKILLIVLSVASH